jgi:hypothetical protein
MHAILTLMYQNYPFYADHEILSDPEGKETPESDPAGLRPLAAPRSLPGNGICLIHYMIMN